MKMSHKLTLAMLAGITIGLAAGQVIHADPAKLAPAYVIAEVEKDPAKAQDPVASQRYKEEAPKTLAAFGAQYLVRAGVDKIQTVEGDAPKGNLVIIKFDSVEKARGWYYSPAYEVIKPIRRNSTKSRLLIVEGVVAP